MKRIKRFLAGLVVALALCSGLLLTTPMDAPGVPLPIHCDELIHGDCGYPWDCFVICMMELTGIEDFCQQHPEAPQCH